MFRGGKVQSHGLNTDQDSEQGKDEKSKVTERGYLTFSNLWLGPCFYPWRETVVRHFRPPLLLHFQFSCPDPCSIRVSSVAKIFPEVTSLDDRMSQSVFATE